MWQAGSLASNICQARPGGQPLVLKLELGRRVPLAGPELEAFYASRAAHAVDEDEPHPLLTPRQAFPLCSGVVWACGPVMSYSPIPCSRPGRHSRCGQAWCRHASL